MYRIHFLKIIENFICMPVITLVANLIFSNSIYAQETKSLTLNNRADSLILRPRNVADSVQQLENITLDQMGINIKTID